jgi:uncharacterized protein
MEWCPWTRAPSTAAPATSVRPSILRCHKQDDEFEWDDTKAGRILTEHGVTFGMARDVFSDPFAIDWPDHRQDYGGDRYCVIGMVENRLLFVAYTLRGDRIRTISARGAEPYEHRRYHEENH